MQKLIIDVARCEEIMKAIGDKSHPCNKIVNFQEVAARDIKEKFQVPEAFCGHIDESRFLIISSNPSYDLNESNEDWCKSYRLKRFPVMKDSDGYIFNFFYNRLVPGHYKNKRYLTSCLKIAAWADVCKKSLEEKEIKKEYENLEEIKKEYENLVTLTEIVHCKSTNEIGVSKACKKCADLYFKRVIELFMENKMEKKFIILCGIKLRNYLRSNKKMIELLEGCEEKGITICKAYQPTCKGKTDKERKDYILKSLDEKKWL